MACSEIERGVMADGLQILTYEPRCQRITPPLGVGSLPVNKSCRGCVRKNLSAGRGGEGGKEKTIWGWGGGGKGGGKSGFLGEIK